MLYKGLTHINKRRPLAGLDHSGAYKRAGQVSRDNQLVQVAGIAPVSEQIVRCG